jgi:hypothetical protein
VEHGRREARLRDAGAASGRLPHLLRAGGATALSDLIAILPEVGVLVIEVKDWRLAELASVNADTVTIARRDTATVITHPRRQAREYMLRLMEECRKHPQASMLMRQSKKIAMMGALDHAARRLIVHSSATKRSADFIAFLEEIDRLYGPHPGSTAKPIVIVLDNGPIHTSKATLAALAARAHWLTVEWLPKYAPLADGLAHVACGNGLDALRLKPRCHR